MKKKLYMVGKESSWPIWLWAFLTGLSVLVSLTSSLFDWHEQFIKPLVFELIPNSQNDALKIDSREFTIIYAHLIIFLNFAWVVTVAGFVFYRHLEHNRKVLAQFDDIEGFPGILAERIGRQHRDSVADIAAKFAPAAENIRDTPEALVPTLDVAGKASELFVRCNESDARSVRMAITSWLVEEYLVRLSRIWSGLGVSGLLMKKSSERVNLSKNVVHQSAKASSHCQEGELGWVLMLTEFHEVGDEYVGFSSEWMKTLEKQFRYTGHRIPVVFLCMYALDSHDTEKLESWIDIRSSRLRKALKSVNECKSEVDGEPFLKAFYVDNLYNRLDFTEEERAALEQFGTLVEIFDYRLFKSVVDFNADNFPEDADTGCMVYKATCFQDLNVPSHVKSGFHKYRLPYDEVCKKGQAQNKNIWLLESDLEFRVRVGVTDGLLVEEKLSNSVIRKIAYACSRYSNETLPDNSGTH